MSSQLWTLIAPLVPRRWWQRVGLGLVLLIAVSEATIAVGLVSR